MGGETLKQLTIFRLHVLGPRALPGCVGFNRSSG